MYCVLGDSQAPGLCSLILWRKFNDRFTTALAVTLTVVAQLLAAVGTCLLIRDGNNARTLVETLHNADLVARQNPLDLEQSSVHSAVDNHQNLRYLFASFAFIGTLLVAFTHHHVWSHDSDWPADFCPVWVGD